MQDVYPCHIGCFLHHPCLSDLQLARIPLPLNIAVIMSSHPLQDLVHVRFLVPFLGASVVLIPPTDESTELQEYTMQRIVSLHDPAIVDVPEAHDKQGRFPSVLRSPTTNDFCAGIACCSAA